MLNRIEEIKRKALAEYEASLSKIQLYKYRKGLAYIAKQEAKRSELDKWISTNKLIGEVMPIIEHSLIDDMRDKDKASLDRRPDIVLVYRAMSLREYEELRETREVKKQSWTFKLRIADFFLTHGQTSRERVICRMHILKEDILAYTNERQEQEVIVRRGKITMSIPRKQFIRS